MLKINSNVGSDGREQVLLESGFIADFASNISTQLKLFFKDSVPPFSHPLFASKIASKIHDITFS